MAQRNEKNITEYLHRVEELYCRLPSSDITVGFNVVKGMKDEPERKTVLFNCSNDQDFTWKRVKRVVTAAYQIIEQIDPLQGKYGFSEYLSTGLVGQDWQ